MTRKEYEILHYFEIRLKAIREAMKRDGLTSAEWVYWMLRRAVLLETMGAIESIITREDK